MEQIIRMLFQILLMFLAVVALHGTALGDIPPPPPDIPGTEIVLPEPIIIAVAGLILTAAIAWAGSIAARNGNPSRSKMSKAVAAAVLVATIASAVFAYVEYKGYAETRRNYRSPGPVESWDPPDSNQDIDSSPRDDEASASE